MNNDHSHQSPRLGTAKLGETTLYTPATFQQVHDFTHGGEARFMAFLAQHGQEACEPNHIKPDLACMDCLGVLEDALNAVPPQPLVWVLSPLHARDNENHPFKVELDDLVIEAVTPESE